MPYRPAITYRYDGSLDGLFTCLMESYQKKKSRQKSFRRIPNKPVCCPAVRSKQTARPPRELKPPFPRKSVRKPSGSSKKAFSPVCRERNGIY